MSVFEAVCGSVVRSKKQKTRRSLDGGLAQRNCGMTSEGTLRSLLVSYKQPGADANAILESNAPEQLTFA
jgi:hypothetical protein